MPETEPIVIILASSNRGKLVELRHLLPDNFVVRTASETGIVMPEETGTTFAENATLKALAGLEQIGEITLADDSGLEVDALDGAPGVRSARFAGEPSNDDANNRLLLGRLGDIQPERRSARFRSSVAIALTDGTIHVSDGTLEGTILTEPRGNNGFGYDPLFQPAGLDRTLAELSLAEKNEISHRSRALRAALDWFLKQQVT